MKSLLKENSAHLAIASKKITITEYLIRYRHYNFQKLNRQKSAKPANVFRRNSKCFNA